MPPVPIAPPAYPRPLPRFPPDASALHRIESVVSTAPPPPMRDAGRDPAQLGAKLCASRGEAAPRFLYFCFESATAVRARGAGKVNRHGRRGESRAARARGAGGEDRRLGARRGGLVAVHDEILDNAEFAYGSERAADAW